MPLVSNGGRIRVREAGSSWLIILVRCNGFSGDQLREIWPRPGARASRICVLCSLAEVYSDCRHCLFGYSRLYFGHSAIHVRIDGDPGSSEASTDHLRNRQSIGQHLQFSLIKFSSEFLLVAKPLDNISDPNQCG